MNEIVVEAPGRPTPALVRLVLRWLAPVVQLCHRPTLTGIENLPERGPFLLVANHSAGLGIAEILTFLVLYLKHVGPERPLAGFAHPTGFRVFPLSAGHRAVGTIPSTYAAAEQTLSKGVPILVFPGGDHETLRPIWEANRVDFGGRLGFLRIARAAGVPIVPLGIRGSHYTAPVLWRSKLLATLLVAPRLIGTKRWGISLLGVIGAALIWRFGPASWALRAGICWLWLGSPLIFLAWIPWTIRMRIGAPIAAKELFPGAGGLEEEENEEELRRALPRVEAAVQVLVDR
ncbi:MAG: 1-acyl-sn-glycerol-3-phosphate acyltransferase [Byssovorax sp.]